jgi:2-aminobenzoate-CoA ligase
LPPQELWPAIKLDNFQLPENLNSAEVFLDKHCTTGKGDDICFYGSAGAWTYKKMQESANQIAQVLIQDLGLEPGNRVLLRSANNPMLVACWFGVIKAGGIVVTTMPLLRAKELNDIVQLGEIDFALCDERLKEEMLQVQPRDVKTLLFDGLEVNGSELEAKMNGKANQFINYASKADDVALIGFTSGTTGIPKMTAHFHRDLVNICRSFPEYSLEMNAQDVVIGSPPIGFTFGLGGLVLFPMYYGAKGVLLEKPSPELLLQAIQEHGVSICFTAPTAWKMLCTKWSEFSITSLRKCVSAGETLPAQVWEDWFNTTGLKIIDGIGATEMLHIFISSQESNLKPGATGVAIPGYEAKVVDKNGKELPRGKEGKLAVRGITGCRYLNREEKQREYVQNGWNITGDVFFQDEEGYFHYVARGDDMIISSGYNIAAISVENVLLGHPGILETAVVGEDDLDRGKVVAAYIVLKEGVEGSEVKKKEIQDWFKQVAAPYKYPRRIYFLSELPKTQTGKLQRYKLKKTQAI